MHGRADHPADAPGSPGRVTDAAELRLLGEPVRRSPATRLRPGLADRTDAHLLRLAREGDPHAYEAIVARYREPLRRSCARISPERSEDAVQQALLSAWLALERGADVRELRPWLYSIARNAAIDQTRGVRSELVELGPEVPGGEDPASAEARRREVSEVLEAVAALPDRQRRALVDTALHGRPTEAVASDLGLSGGALRQLVHRARTTVRAAVPTVAFPIPAWIAELLGEEGARRGAVLLGSGSGAAVIAKATATVATVGAVVIGGVTFDHSVDRRAASSAGPSRSSGLASSADTTGTAGSGVVRGALLADVTLLRPAAGVGVAPPSGSRDPAPAGGPAADDAHGGVADVRSPGGDNGQGGEAPRPTAAREPVGDDSHSGSNDRGQGGSGAEPSKQRPSSDSTSHQHDGGTARHDRGDGAAESDARSPSEGSGSPGASSQDARDESSAAGVPTRGDGSSGHESSSESQTATEASASAPVTSGSRPSEADDRDNSESGASQERSLQPMEITS